ncbi:MAG TPA: hypothetical protein DCE42_23715 [Myxococcales bacterium]|nr:hypothetical protein [Myxococcales bacterium]
MNCSKRCRRLWKSVNPSFKPCVCVGKGQVVNQIASFLKEIEIFQGLSDISAERLAKRVELQTFEAQKLILRRGAPGDRMYVIYEGEVRIPIVDEHGQMRFITHLHKGQVFGEMALLTGDPRNADVVANTDCTCLVISKDTLEDLIQSYPEVAKFLTAILGERLCRSGGIRKVGKYNLIGELGRGGMAVVYEGVHPILERSVAIKMLSHELVYHQEFAERFREEARIIANLRHPNIVEVFDTEEAYATFFIVMEKLSGTDLRDIVRTKGGLSYEEIRILLREMASALDCAHSKGVIHRDVKPSNIVISPDGKAKLTDFGLAVRVDMNESKQFAPASSVGTPCYMAPEQIAKKHLDGRADIYALGIITYELLIGQPPYLGSVVDVLKKHLRGEVPHPRKINPDVPEDLDTFVRTATAKKPEERFQSCAEIVNFFRDPSETLNADRLEVQTLTFVYDKTLQKKVDALLEECRQKAKAIDGLIVR